VATTSILAVPGIGRVDQGFLNSLAAVADRHNWNADGIAGVISHESGFNAAAHTPIVGQTATGLIQFTEHTANTLGTTTAALRTMSATQQLPYVEAFFAKTLPTVPADPADYILATYGRSDLIGKDPSVVIDSGSSTDPNEVQRYKLNSALDRANKGYITVGDLRSVMNATFAGANGRRLPIVPEIEILSSPTKTTQPILLVTIAALSLSVAAGYAAHQTLKRWPTR
jgi:hypothetical protein